MQREGCGTRVWFLEADHLNPGLTDRAIIWQTSRHDMVSVDSTNRRAVYKSRGWVLLFGKQSVNRASPKPQALRLAVLVGAISNMATMQHVNTQYLDL